MKIKKSTLKKLKEDYIDDKDFWDMKKLKRASKAIGPLAIWLESI